VIFSYAKRRKNTGTDFLNNRISVEQYQVSHYKLSHRHVVYQITNNRNCVSFL